MNAQPSQMRREEQRSAARRAILDSTQALLVDGGYERFTMRRLAQNCGYTAPSIYHHFGDKPRLLEALLEERFAIVLQQLRQVQMGPDPVENIRALAAQFVEFGLRNPEHFRLLSLPREGSAPAPPSAEESIALVQAPLERLAAAGRLRPPNVTAAFQVIWAVLHGVISLRTMSPDYEWVDDLASHAIEAITRGLVEPAQSRGPSGGSR